MILNSNLVLKHSCWRNLQELYPVQGSPSKPKIGIFPRLIDLFIVACSIGMCNNERIPNDENDEIASINSKTYNDPNNDDLKRTLDYLLKILILTLDIPELKNYDRSTKEKLAFSSDFTVEKFNAASILCEYANAGALKLSSLITDQDTETINNIVEYINDLKKSMEILPDIDDFDSI